MSDVMPCAWCGKEPYTDFPEEFYRCMTKTCVMFTPHVDWEIKEWNARQSAILARRKADFEAGLSAMRAPPADAARVRGPR